MNKKKQIAVVGSGISGLSIAWLLRDIADVSLFEKEARFGGHSNTVSVVESKGDAAAGNATVNVDTGFIVLNDRNYPNLIDLFETIGVDTFDTQMSFAVSEQGGEYEYAGSGINTLFAQRRNVVSRRHWRMLRDILRFNKLATAYDGSVESITVGEFLDRHHFSSELTKRYILPMAAAIWSCPVDTMRQFPASSLFHFFKNHGLLGLSGRPQWRSVVGGSRQYVNRLIDDIGANRCHHDPVVCVTRDSDGVELSLESGSARFDEVIFACHADQALALLADASVPEQRVLSPFHYQKNSAWLHTDERLMPKRKSVWSAWNYLTECDALDAQDVSVTYWMNLLQGLHTSKQYFVTLNPLHEPDAGKTIEKIAYKHPVFSQSAINAQQQIASIQGCNRTWFCGSYCGYGFHEDGLKSSVAVFNKMGHSAPWQSAGVVESAPRSRVGEVV